MDFDKSQKVMDAVSQVAKPFGFRVGVVYDKRKEPWARFPTHTWTYGLVPLSTPSGAALDVGVMVGPTFSCSHRRLPSSTGKKFQELRSWASSTAAFLRNGGRQL